MMIRKMIRIETAKKITYLTSWLVGVCRVEHRNDARERHREHCVANPEAAELLVLSAWLFGKLKHVLALARSNIIDTSSLQ